MAKSFLIASGKGGVGKSTLAAGLSRAFTAKGLTVALLDADVGLRCADLMLNLQDRIIYDFSDVLDGKCALSAALYPVPGDERLHLLSAAQLIRASDVRPKDVTRIVERLMRTHDIVLVDCPAGIGRSMKNTLGSTEKCILVATPDDVSIRDAERVSMLLRKHGEEHPFLLFNRVDRHLIRTGEMPVPQEVALSLDMPLCGIVPDSPEIYRALLNHKTAYDCGDANVRKAYDRIASRLMGDPIDVPDYRLGVVARFFYRKPADGTDVSS